MAELNRIVLLSVLCLSVTGSPGPGPITCSTSGTVLEGTTAAITCDFHGDLNKTQSDFYVYKTSSGESEIMALCGWNAGSPQCRLEGGCTLKTASTDGKVMFEIPFAIASHSGDYVCKTLPAHEANAVNCNLTVIKNEITDGRFVTCHTSSPVTVGEDASLFCMFTKSIGITGVTLENEDKEEIVLCNEEEGCSVLKEGYQVDEETTTHLRVSIPHVTPDKAGTYICRSTYIKQQMGMCTLGMKDPDTDESRTGSSILKQILPPVYAILACFVLLFLVGLVVLYQQFLGCFKSHGDKLKGNKDSEQGLLDDNGNRLKRSQVQG